MSQLPSEGDEIFFITSQVLLLPLSDRRIPFVNFKKSFPGSQIWDFIKAHTNKVTVRIGLGIIIVVIVVLSIYLYKRYNSYDDYKVLNYIKVDSSSNSKYLSYQDFVIKYSGDGISYIDDEGTVWDESYQMKTPIVDICEDYIAVADKNSNDIYLSLIHI